MVDARVARLRIFAADERIFTLRREMDETEAKLESLRRALVEALEDRTEAMPEMREPEVYI